MREPEGGRGDGGCFYTLVSGNTKYQPFAIQASKSFLVMRAHEKEKVKLPKCSAPRAAGNWFPSLESSTATVLCNDCFSVLPGGQRGGSLKADLFLLERTQGQESRVQV